MSATVKENAIRTTHQTMQVMCMQPSFFSMGALQLGHGLAFVMIHSPTPFAFSRLHFCSHAVSCDENV